jgi:gliding motility-associated-like protein
VFAHRVCLYFVAEIITHILMKKTMLTAMASLLLLLLGSTASAQQSSNDPVIRYRITAYKKGDSQVNSQSNTLEVVPPVSLYIPNAFTPNGDGLNDTFGAIGEGISEYRIMIFNRWGNMIFESNDIGKQWDGTFKGEKAELGVYVYKITAKGPKSYIVKKEGSVTLVQ